MGAPKNTCDGRKKGKVEITHVKAIKGGRATNGAYQGMEVLTVVREGFLSWHW